MGKFSNIFGRAPDQDDEDDGGYGYLERIKKRLKESARWKEKNDFRFTEDDVNESAKSRSSRDEKKSDRQPIKEEKDDKEIDSDSEGAGQSNGKLRRYFGTRKWAKETTGKENDEEADNPGVSGERVAKNQIKNGSKQSSSNGNSEISGKNDPAIVEKKDGRSEPSRIQSDRNFISSETNTSSIRNSFKTSETKSGGIMGTAGNSSDIYMDKTTSTGTTGIKSAFSIISEDADDKKRFIKGKTRFASTFQDKDMDGADAATETVKESGRTVFQFIRHMSIQAKNVIAIAVTIFLGPVAGLLVSLLGSVLVLLLMVMFAVVAVISVIFTAMISVFATVIAAIISLFVDELNTASPMYQYAYTYATEYITELDEAKAECDEIIIVVNGAETDKETATISYEVAYLAYLALNEEATYVNSDLDLDEDSADSNMGDLFEDTEENEVNFEEIFDGLYHYKIDEGTLYVYVNSWNYYSLKEDIDSMNMVYFSAAVPKDTEYRTDLGMTEDAMALQFGKE